MKKNIHKCLIVVTTIACLVLVFGIILPQVYMPRENVRRFQKVIDTSLMVCDWHSVHTPEELESNSDIVAVVKAEKQEDDGVVKPVGNYLLLTGTVEEVISGNTAVGDQLLIYEPCDFYKNETLYSFNGYYPMNVGESYLLFLQQEDDETSKLYGRYYIVENIYGKYPLNAKTGIFCRWYLNMAEELEIADMDTTSAYITKYQQWYEAVRKLYPDVFE